MGKFVPDTITLQCVAERRSVRGAFLALGALMAAACASAENLPEPLPLAWCLARAGAQNPGIAARAAAAEAAHERLAPAGALDDPRLRYEASNVPTSDLDFSSTPLSGHQFGLSQRVPFPGVLSGRRAAAEARAESKSFELTHHQLSVAARVEATWAELGFAQRALEITDGNIELLRQLVRVAEAKYRVGSGLQQDVLRAQVELTALLDERLTRHAAIERASAALAELLDLEAVALPRTEELADTPGVPELPVLSAAIETRNPQLAAHQAEVEEAERLVRVSELEGYPDFDLGIGYRVRKDVSGDAVDGADFLSASVAIRLPIDRAKWGAKVAEKRALLRQAKAAYRSSRASLRAALRTAHAELTRAEAEVALLETGLVPQARQSLASSRSGYEVGRIGFLSLLDSQVRLLNAELRQVRAQADRRIAFAALEAASGERLR